VQKLIKKSKIIHFSEPVCYSSLVSVVN